MDILFLLIPIALIFLVIALALFFWAIRNGQYDDMDSQSMKIIMDEHRSDQKVKKGKDDAPIKDQTSEDNAVKDNIIKDQQNDT